MQKLTTDQLGRPDLAAYQHLPKFPVALVLDNIRSLHNVGSAFRTADAFLAAHIHLCGITGTPPHREIHKTALGATDSVAWTYWEHTTQAIEHLKANGFTIVALEQTDASIPLQNFSFQQGRPYAFVFGNEMFGVADEVIALCDAAIEIPQFGTKHSLNVSVTVGIALWAYLQGVKSEK